MTRFSNVLITSVLTTLSLTCARVLESQVANPAAKASLSAEDEKAVGSFQAAAKVYLEIIHKAPSEVKLKQTTDIADLEKRRRALREIVIAARPNAKQGDLFTPNVANIFRRLLAEAMNGSGGNEVRRSLQHAEPNSAAGALQIAVNHDFPNQKGQPLQSSPPTVLQCLPVLPKGLEYRMVGNILVLRDTEANLVVDYLPNAHR